jgi:hypothetical protein
MRSGVPIVEGIACGRWLWTNAGAANLRESLGRRRDNSRSVLVCTSTCFDVSGYLSPCGRVAFGRQRRQRRRDLGIATRDDLLIKQRSADGEVAQAGH